MTCAFWFLGGEDPGSNELVSSLAVFLSAKGKKRKAGTVRIECARKKEREK